MLNRYKKVLKEKGLIHLKTDSQFLHGYTLGILEKLKAKVLLSSHDIYKGNVNCEDPILNIKTFYEHIFLKNKQPITYICFQIN